jgi:C-terminal processing protease CtpA/Prc
MNDSKYNRALNEWLGPKSLNTKRYTAVQHRPLGRLIINRSGQPKICVVAEPGPVGVELTPNNKIVQFSPTSSLKAAGASVGDIIVKVGDTDVTSLDNNKVRDLITTTPRPLTFTLKKAQKAGKRRTHRKTRRSRR